MRNSVRTIKIKFTDFWGGWIETNNFIYNTLSRRYKIEISDDPDYLFFSIFGSKHLNYNCIKIFYTGENIIPDFNLCDYAIGFANLSFSDRYLRYPLYYLYENDFYACLNKHKNCFDDVLSNKIGFCSFVASNHLGATFRGDFFDALTKYKSVASGGKWKNNIGYAVPDKIGFQSQYKFCIAFENASQPGYITEKLVQAFASNTIPIYWGAPDITNTFNDKSFINCHKYSSVSEIIDEIIKIDNDDKLYKEMLRQPAFINSYEEVLSVNDDLDKFLTNILRQPYESAKRYNRDGINSTLYTKNIILRETVFRNSFYYKWQKCKCQLLPLIHRIIPQKPKFHE